LLFYCLSGTGLLKEGKGYWPWRANSFGCGLANRLYPSPKFLSFYGFLGWLGLLACACALRAPGDALRAWAFRVVGARLEGPKASAALDQRLAADGARLVQHLRALSRLSVLADVGPVVAVRISRASDERAVAAGTLD